MKPAMTPDELKACIRTIPDFPVPGIRFRDITTLLKNGRAFRAAVEYLFERAQKYSFNKVAGVEARGYIFAATLSYLSETGLVIVRKKGKLPSKSIEVTYTLEYGTATLEVHEDGVESGDRVLIVDDLLATGGTARATGELIEKSGGKVAAYLFLIELVDLNGRQTLQNAPVESIITFTESE